MDTSQYFESPQNWHHRQYETARAILYENMSANDAARKFGYTTSTIYSLVRDFKRRIANGTLDEYLFANPKLGRIKKENDTSLKNQIISLRKHYLSVEEIKEKLDAKGEAASETYVFHTIKEAGFARLPRRTKLAKAEVQSTVKIDASKTEMLSGARENFNSSNVGLLCFLPIIKSYGIDQLIAKSQYPATRSIPKINSILSFIALKLSGIKRYTKDDLWCMDRGLGLFAGLNVLPKAAWFTSYSHRVTRDMNVSFLRALHDLWVKHGLLSDTANLDFTTVPYWGNDAHLENNWSGTRHHALASILAAISQDPDSGIITYGDADVRQKTEQNVVVEFLDFYRSNGDTSLKYVVFDSKFTVYKNLRKLDDNNVKFITIRRRGSGIVSSLEALPTASWKKVRVMAGDGKNRLLKVHEENIFLREYGNKEIRQIAITGHGKIKPALIITNDFDLSQADIIRKYAKRWIVEKTISEQTHFFHFNRLSQGYLMKIS